jgi:hypothetical protein
MNLTWSEVISVRETVQYTPSPLGPKKTQFEQRAEITALCGGWQKIKNKIESFSIERFQQNAVKGREGFEMVLAKCREVFAEEKEKRAREAEDREGVLIMGDMDGGMQKMA